MKKMEVRHRISVGKPEELSLFGSLGDHPGLIIKR
jgi:hypothetical protein